METINVLEIFSGVLAGLLIGYWIAIKGIDDE
jgi:uncharacterized protein YneF (UPF0154 family)